MVREAEGGAEYIYIHFRGRQNPPLLPLWRNSEALDWQFFLTLDYT